MDKKTIYALVAGTVLYILLLYLAYIQRDLTGQQLILMLVAPLLIGFLSGGVKRGLILSFLLSFTMFIVEVIVMFGPGALSNPNVFMAILLMMALPLTGLSAGLGAVGGLIGRLVFKKPKKSD